MGTHLASRQSLDIEGAEHPVAAFPVLEYFLGLWFVAAHVLRVEKHILFAPTALILVVVLESLPLRFRSISIELRR